ncbi:putative plastid-lipid-associated protein 11, chloroplastic, partial [Drosera capensis]
VLKINSARHRPGDANSLRPFLYTSKSQDLSLIADQHRGLATQRDPQRRLLIIESIHALSELGKGTVMTRDESLSWTWRMLWTTEKEQLYVIRNEPVLGNGGRGCVAERKKVDMKLD